MINLIKLLYRSRLRSVDIKKSSFIIGLVVIYISLFIYQYSESIIELINTALFLNDNAIFFKYLFLFTLFDFTLKLSLRSNIPVIPVLLKTLPLKTYTWNMFIFLNDSICIWNIYPILFTSSILYITLNTKYFILLSIFQFLICYINSSIVRIIKVFINISQKQWIGFLTITLYLTLIYFCCKIEFPHLNLYFFLLQLFFVAVVFFYVGTLILKYFYHNRSVLSNKTKTVQYRTYNYFRIEILSVIRCKRIRQMIINAEALPLIAVYNLLLFSDYSIYSAQISSLVIIFFIALPSFVLCQNIIGIEGNYISLLTTKPLSFIELMNDKFKFFLFLSSINVSLILPLFVLGKINLLHLISCFIYLVGFQVLLFFNLLIPFSKIQLNKSSMFNQQGLSVLQMFVVIILFCLMGFIFVKIRLNFDENTSSFILFLIGIFLLLLKNSIFNCIAYLFGKRNISEYIKF